ncbi:hypothetical protein WN944_011218 [Citrus x changshan-huyou]|uniref:Uncharacterized protein n=1 Tax=Citrus x changshan-huyou TaxID=2935761 RepID=A0AAP0R1A9_9ROSI
MAFIAIFFYGLNCQLNLPEAILEMTKADTSFSAIHAENSTLQITTSKLNGMNFIECSQFMKISLKSKGKDPKFEIRHTENYMVVSWKSMNATDYYNTLKGLLSELDLHQNVKLQCSKDAKAIRDLMEREHVIQILLELNSVYEQARDRVLRKNPLPDFDGPFAIIRAKNWWTLKP